MVTKMIDATDVRAVLPAIRVPTLVIARAESPVPPEHGRYLAEHIPGARYVELPGSHQPHLGRRSGCDRR